jgi:acyl dehydratase
MGQELLFFDDLAVGDTFTSATHTLTVDDIKRFAAEFDPQPFHLDDMAAGQTIFGGLAASGCRSTAKSSTSFRPARVPTAAWW